MRASLTRNAAIITAGAALASWTLIAAQPAGAWPVDFVPCSTVTLSSDLTTQTTGQLLRLAPHCTYDLTAALPDITAQHVAIWAGRGTVLERSTAEGTPDFSLLTVDAGASLTVSGLTLLDGLAYTGGAIDNNGTLKVTRSTFTDNTGTWKGGAIASGLNGMATLMVTRSTFTGNSASARGGGIASGYGNDSTATITGSTFTGNTSGNWGGGIYSEDSLTVNGSDFTDNSSPPTGGGGIASLGTSTTVHGGVFTGNTGGFGGGILVESGPTVIVGVRFIDNTALYGGGLYAPDLAMTGSTFIRNTADISGGAVESFSAGTITRSQFRHNSADHVGGAIYIPSDPVGSTLTVNRSLISGNTATDGGGGIYTGDGNSSVTLTGFTHVIRNDPDNCEPADTITGCP